MGPTVSSPVGHGRWNARGNNAYQPQMDTDSHRYCGIWNSICVNLCPSVAQSQTLSTRHHRYKLTQTTVRNVRLKVLHNV
jgi:hypothetical protein